MTGETWRLGRRPALDGVRGAAIVLVLAGHGWFPAGSGGAGKVGVAVFFTLSGFLITSLLLEERARTGRVDFRAFYLRRARRLLPASLVAVGVFVVLAAAMGSFWLTPQAAVLALFYLGNLHPYGLVGHFWSLAVEEQFYLVWPWVLVALLRRRRCVLPVALLGVAACSLAFRLAVGGTLLFQQADALLIGCALAAWMHGRDEQRPPTWVASVSIAALLGLSALPMQRAETWGMTGAGLATAALIWTTGQGTRVRVLEMNMLGWVGRRSYALYLWHYPTGFIVAMGFGIHAWLPFVTIVAPLSLALTVLSWRFVESPFLQADAKHGQPRHAARRDGQVGAGVLVGR